MTLSKRYVLDTSALLAFQLDEAGSDIVEELLSLGQKQKTILFTSFVTWTEIYYITAQKLGKERALETLAQLKTLPLERTDPDEEQIVLAGDLKADYPISFADAYVAATAIQREAILIHKDPEFEALNDRLQHQPLPYKKLQ